MAHISVDLPAINKEQKKKLIESLQNVLSDIADIDKSEISVSLHELPQENMNNSDNVERKDIKAINNKNKINEKQAKKKSIFKEIFP